MTSLFLGAALKGLARLGSPINQVVAPRLNPERSKNWRRELVSGMEGHYLFGMVEDQGEGDLGIAAKTLISTNSCFIWQPLSEICE